MYAFHRAFYVSLRALLVPYFKTLGRYNYKVYSPKSENYLMLANHNTNWDFIFFALALRKQMYFVASEHIFRQGFTSFLIKTLVDPIPRKKGASADSTVRMIKERLADGKNVCMMAEGNRSFSGETGFISPATAKLVKESGSALITFVIRGGYFVNPRWSNEPRRGPISGEVVNEYTVSQIAEMSEDEIYAAICSDLYVNAYEDQVRAPHKYKCKHPAEHLETALFLCPECHSFSTLESKDDKFFCRECGMKLRLNDFGYFESLTDTPTKFATILDWDKWQQKYLHEYLPQHNGDTEKPLFSDNGIRLASIQAGKGTSTLVEGRLSLYGDRMEICGDGKTVSFMLTDIKKLSITLTDTMLFTADDGYYEMKGTKNHYSALKYLIAWRLLIGKEYK